MRCVSYIFIDGNSILRWVEKRKMVCCWFRKQVSTENEIRNALARALLYLLMLPSLTNEDLFLLQGHLRKLRLFPYANMSEIYTTTSRMYKIDNHWISMHWLRSILIFDILFISKQLNIELHEFPQTHFQRRWLWVSGKMKLFLTFCTYVQKFVYWPYSWQRYFQ